MFSILITMYFLSWTPKANVDKENERDLAAGKAVATVVIADWLKTKTKVSHHDLRRGCPIEDCKACLVVGKQECCGQVLCAAWSLSS